VAQLRWHRWGGTDCLAAWKCSTLVNTAAGGTGWFSAKKARLETTLLIGLEFERGRVVVGAVVGRLLFYIGYSSGMALV
jgi:hypothetical protein